MRVGSGLIVVAVLSIAAWVWSVSSSSVEAAGERRTAATERAAATTERVELRKSVGSINAKLDDISAQLNQLIGKDAARARRARSQDDE